MTLKESLIDISQNWVRVRGETFAGHPIAKSVRHDFREAVENLLELQIHVDYKVKARADIPWLSILDPRVTKSTQDGFYPV